MKAQKYDRHPTPTPTPPWPLHPPAADISLQCNRRPLTLSGSTLGLVLTVAVAKVQPLLVGMFGLAAATEPGKYERNISKRWQSPKWRHLQVSRGLGQCVSVCVCNPWLHKPREDQRVS